MADYSKTDVIDLSKVEISADQIARSKEILRLHREAGQLMALPYLLMAAVWLQAFFLPESTPSQETMSWASEPVRLIAPAIAQYAFDLSMNGELDLSWAALTSFYGSIVCAILSLKYYYRTLSLTDVNHLVFMRKKKGKKVFDVYAFGLVSAVLTLLMMFSSIYLAFGADLYHGGSIRRSGVNALAVVPLIAPFLVLSVRQGFISIKILRSKEHLKNPA